MGRRLQALSKRLTELDNAICILHKVTAGAPTSYFSGRDSTGNRQDIDELAKTDATRTSHRPAASLATIPGERQQSAGPSTSSHQVNSSVASSSQNLAKLLMGISSKRCYLCWVVTQARTLMFEKKSFD